MESGNQISGHFLGWLLRSSYVRHQIAGTASYTTRALTNGKLLGKVLVQIPSFDEQEVIAEVLSDVDETILRTETLIKKKHRVLQELIDRLFRKHARDNVQLGDIGECIRGVGYKPHQVFLKEQSDSLPLLRANNVQDNRIELGDIYHVSNECVDKHQILRKGDVLICAANGSRRLVGKAALIDSNMNACFGAFMAVFRTSDLHWNPSFLSFFFNSHYYRQQLEVLLEGSTLNNLSGGDILSLRIPQFKKSEQDDVVSLIGSVKSELDVLIESLRKSKALKQSMMETLLTGKIRLT